MKRKRPETTIYLGDEVQQKLQERQRSFPHPPSLSAMVREAVEQYLVEKPVDGEALSLASWVEMTEPYLMLLRAKGIDVSTDVLLKTLHEAEESRICNVLRGEEQ